MLYESQEIREELANLMTMNADTDREAALRDALKGVEERTSKRQDDIELDKEKPLSARSCKMLTLYELAEKQMMLQELIDEGIGGEERDLLIMQKNDACEWLEKKLNSYGKIALNMGAEKKSIEDEISRLTELKKEKDAEIKNLKDKMLLCLQVTGKKKLKGPHCTLSIKSGASSVEILNEELIPDSFMTSKTTTNVDKAKLKNFLKDLGDEEVEYARLSSTISLTVK